MGEEQLFLENVEHLAKILVALIALATFMISVLSVLFGRRLAKIEKWQEIHDSSLVAEGEWRGEVKTRLKGIEDRLDALRSCPHPECPLLRNRRREENAI